MDGARVRGRFGIRTSCRTEGAGLWLGKYVEVGAIAFSSSQCYDRRMKEKIWFNKANSFEDARDFDVAYYLSLSSSERIEAVQILRESHFKATGCLSDENGKRLRRVFRVIKRA